MNATIYFSNIGLHLVITAVDMHNLPCQTKEEEETPELVN